MYRFFIYGFIFWKLSKLFSMFDIAFKKIWVLFLGSTTLGFE
jgi:hypothetical protein